MSVAVIEVHHNGKQDPGKTARMAKPAPGKVNVGKMERKICRASDGCKIDGDFGEGGN